MPEPKPAPLELAPVVVQAAARAALRERPATAVRAVPALDSVAPASAKRARSSVLSGLRTLGKNLYLASVAQHARRRVRNVRVAAPIIVALLLGSAGLILARPRQSVTLLANSAALTRARLVSENTLQIVQRDAQAAALALERAPEPATSEVLPKGSKRRKLRAAHAAAVAVRAAPRGSSSTASPAAGSHAAFDIARANQEINTASARARSCGRLSAAQQQANVTLTFEPSGRVRVVQVAPGAGGTSTRWCVLSAMRGLRVPPFRGHEVTVSRRVVLNSSPPRDFRKRD
jgi:hypothetical protein